MKTWLCYPSIQETVKWNNSRASQTGVLWVGGIVMAQLFWLCHQPRSRSLVFTQPLLIVPYFCVVIMKPEIGHNHVLKCGEPCSRLQGTPFIPWIPQSMGWVKLSPWVPVGSVIILKSEHKSTRPVQYWQPETTFWTLVNVYGTGDPSSYMWPTCCVWWSTRAWINSGSSSFLELQKCCLALPCNGVGHNMFPTASCSGLLLLMISILCDVWKQNYFWFQSCWSYSHFSSHF